MQVGAELAGRRLAFHGGDDLAADDETADIGTAGLLDVLLNEEVRIEPLEGVDQGAAFVYDENDGALYYDANVSEAGYTVVAQVQDGTGAAANVDENQITVV